MEIQAIDRKPETLPYRGSTGRGRDVLGTLARLALEGKSARVDASAWRAVEPAVRGAAYRAGVRLRLVRSTDSVVVGVVADEGVLRELAGAQEDQDQQQQQNKTAAKSKKTR